jgi:hypothetical protein
MSLIPKWRVALVSNLEYYVKSFIFKLNFYFILNFNKFESQFPCILQHKHVAP